MRIRTQGLQALLALRRDRPAPDRTRGSARRAMPQVCIVSAAMVGVIGREGLILRKTIRRRTIHYVAPSESPAMGAVRMSETVALVLRSRASSAALAA